MIVILIVNKNNFDNFSKKYIMLNCAQRLLYTQIVKSDGLAGINRGLSIDLWNVSFIMVGV